MDMSVRQHMSHNKKKLHQLKCMTIIGLTNFDKGKLALCTIVQCVNYWKK